MTLSDIENLKGKFFKCEKNFSEEYWYIEDVKTYFDDYKCVIELQLTSINNDTIDSRRRLQSYCSNRFTRIDNNSVTAEYILACYWHFKSVSEMTKEEFKKEIFAYFDETYYKIFNETIN